MKCSGYHAYTVTGLVDFDRILEEIRDFLKVHEDPATHLDEQYLETFDWRLHAHGYVCKRNATGLWLAPLGGGTVVSASPLSGSRLFWQDFPESALRKKLAAIAGNRALCPLFQVVGQRRNFRLCNRDEKTIIRFSLDSGGILVDAEKRGDFAPYLCLEEVRGYRKLFHRVGKLLSKNGLREMAKEEDFLQLALEVIKRRPGDYSSKISISLQPEQRINKAISLIGLELHSIMERNLPGILDDVDSEFLHDFRVALRRTRSLLSQMKNEIPPGQGGFFRKEFGWLGSVTGPVRDLDVCLQKEEQYRKMLPPALQGGFTHFLEEIRLRRNGALAAMRADLQSARAAKLLENWRNFLAALPKKIDWPAGQQPCRTIAEKALRRCFQRLVRDAGLILEQKDQAAMHRVRIQAKKFRYLTEFFRPLFPAAEVESLLQRLHGLQDDLGDFNDLTVQIKGVQQYRDNPDAKIDVRASLDELLSGLTIEQKRRRKTSVKKCRKFINQEKKHLIEDVFEKKRLDR